MLAKEIMVIVDDGHGWETVYGYKTTPKFDDGTFIRENEFNHAAKVLLMEQLKAQGFNVYDVSPERTDTPLTVRTDRANQIMKEEKYKAYIFISIHFNSMGIVWNDNAGGIETYHYPTSTNGKKLAQCVHNQLLKGTDLKDRGVKSANFHVLRETSMTAILLECGFMSNHTEAKLMLNIEYQQECALEAVKGVCDYFGIKYQEPISKLEEYTRIISPVYYAVWMKHFKASTKLPWEEFLKSALSKKLP